MKRYKVICGKCKAERMIKIHQTSVGERIDWFDNQSDPEIAKIISGRKRLDDHWGFQCVCGNNDLMTEQERRTFNNPAAPAPQEIKEIINNLKPDHPRFIMFQL